jgi:murein DD-endopeptidase MepM/ murein hydrolase activator NlpD
MNVREKYMDNAVQYMREGMNMYEKQNPDRLHLKNVGLPLRGRFKNLLSWDSRSHTGYHKYRYDFMHVDSQGNVLKKGQKGPWGKKNTDYITFGKKIYAVLDGTVSFTKDSEIDQKIGGERFTSANAVAILHENGVSSTYGHLKQNSVRVKKGQEVKKGDVIAEVGSSGMSPRPHLCFGLTDKNSISLSFQFEKTIVNTGSKTKKTNEPYQGGWIIQK